MILLDRLRAWSAHPVPRVAACNAIAMMVAWNQPFYPLYAWWLAGAAAARVACWTWLSTPLFLAVPWVSRRHSIAGRVLLVVAGVANTMLSAKAFGAASAVEWFLLPCALIAALAFRRRETMLAVLPVVAVFAAAVWLHGRYGAPLGDFSAAETRAFARLNGWSVVSLGLYVLAILGSAIWRERRADQARPANAVAAQ